MDTLANIVESFSQRDYTHLTMDRRLALLPQGTSPYTMNLIVNELQHPPVFKVFPFNASMLGDHEAVFTATGVIVGRCLPPFEVTEKTQLNRPKTLYQTVTIIGAGSPTFDNAIEGLDEVYRACERNFPEGKLVANDYSGRRGKALFASTRYFTDAQEAGNMDHIPFTTAEDPDGILEEIASAKAYRRTIDNLVSYWILRRGPDGQPMLFNLNPCSLRMHDIVEIAISFTILPVAEGSYRLLPILRGVTVLEQAHERLRIPRARITGRCMTRRQCGRNKYDYNRFKAPEIVEIRSSDFSSKHRYQSRRGAPYRDEPMNDQYSSQSLRNSHSNDSLRQCRGFAELDSPGVWSNQQSLSFSSSSSSSSSSPLPTTPATHLPDPLPLVNTVWHSRPTSVDPTRLVVPEEKTFTGGDTLYEPNVDLPLGWISEISYNDRSQPDLNSPISHMAALTISDPIHDSPNFNAEFMQAPAAIIY